MKELAERIVGGLCAVVGGVVEAWDSLPPKERVELYTKIKEESRKLARAALEDRIARRYGVRFGDEK